MRNKPIVGTCLRLGGLPWADATVHAVQQATSDLPGREHYSTVTDGLGAFSIAVPLGSRFLCWAESKLTSERIEVSAVMEDVEAGDRLALDVFPRGNLIDLQFENVEAWRGFGRLFANVLCAHSQGIGCYHEVPIGGEVRGISVPILRGGPPDEWYEVRLFAEEGAYIRGFFVRSDGADRTWGKARPELVLDGPSEARVKLIGRQGSPVAIAEVYAWNWMLRDHWIPLSLRCQAGTLNVLTDCPGGLWAGLSTYYVVRCHGYADRFVGRQEIEAGEAVLECGHELTGEVCIGGKALPLHPLGFFTNLVNDSEGSSMEAPPFLIVTSHQGEIHVGGRHALLGHRIYGRLTLSELRIAFGSHADKVGSLVLLHAGFQHDIGVLELQEFGTWTVVISNGAGAEILLLEDMEGEGRQAMPSRPMTDQLDRSGGFDIVINPAVPLVVFIWSASGYWSGRVQVESRQHLQSKGELRLAGRLSGCVLDLDSQPLAGIPVCIQSQSSRTPPIGFSKRQIGFAGFWSNPHWTDADGHFEIDVPTPGDYVIEVSNSVLRARAFWFPPDGHTIVEQNILVDGSDVRLA